MGIDSPVHLIFIGVVALLVLGPNRLPSVARALGHGLREFREAMNLDGEQPIVHPPVVSHPVPDPAGPGAFAGQAAAGVASAPQGDPLAESFERAEAGQQAQVDPASEVPSSDAPDRRTL